METFSYGTTYIWTYSSKFHPTKDSDRKTFILAPPKNSQPTRFNTYAHGIQARRPQEMKFLFRRAGNWIFGFRRRISDTKKRKKKKKEGSYRGNIRGESRSNSWLA